MAQIPRQDPPIRGIGYDDGADILRLPPWVLAKISSRPRVYTGQLTINFFQGGVTTIEWREVNKQNR